MIPIPVQTNGRIYASVFAVFLFCWPLVLFVNDKKHAPNPTVTVCVLIGIMVASFVMNYVRCSSPGLSYWQGLCTIAGFWRSGCVQITALVIIPILFVIHLWMTIISLCSFFAGRGMAEQAFIRMCRRFAPGAFEAQESQEDSEWFRSRR